MGVSEFLRVAIYRKLIIIWSVLIALVVSGAAGLLFPKKYEATAQVQVDSVQRNQLTGAVDHRVRVVDFLGQQAAVAGSRTVALEVIRALSERGALNLSDYEPRWRRETGGETTAGNDLELWAADELLEGVTIGANAAESTLSISYRGDEAAGAARVANAFATAYMDTVLDQKQRRARRNAANFTEETRTLANEVAAAQRDLAEFRDRSGIIPLGGDGVEAVEVEFAAITERLASARADNSEAQSLLQLARSTPRADLANLPIPAEAAAARESQVRLTEALTRLARIDERFGKSYPDYIEAASEARALQATLLAAISDRADFAASRLAALEREAARLSSDAADAQSTREAYQLLQDKVTASQDTFNLLATRALEEALQSRVDTLAVLLLARAIPPSSAATPPLSIFLGLGLAVGAFLGGSIAVFIEFIEGRIRSAETVRQILRAPIIGEVDIKRIKGPLAAGPQRRIAA